MTTTITPEAKRRHEFLEACSKRQDTCEHVSYPEDYSERCILCVIEQAVADLMKAEAPDG